jgi:hypothetical protein
VNELMHVSRKQILMLMTFDKKDILLVVVPRHGLRGRSMRSYTLMDPLGAQAVRRLGFFPGCRGKDVLGEFSR